MRKTLTGAFALFVRAAFVVLPQYLDIWTTRNFAQILNILLWRRIAQSFEQLPKVSRQKVAEKYRKLLKVTDSNGQLWTHSCERKKNTSVYFTKNCVSIFEKVSLTKVARTYEKLLFVFQHSDEELDLQHSAEHHHGITTHLMFSVIHIILNVCTTFVWHDILAHFCLSSNVATTSLTCNTLILPVVPKQEKTEHQCSTTWYSHSLISFF